MDTRTLEALFFVSDEPLTPAVLSQSLEIDRKTADALCERLQQELEERRSGVVLRNVAGGWRLFTHPDTQPVGRALRAVVAAGAPDEGRPRDARDRGVQAAGHPPPGERHPGRELRRRPAGARRSRPGRGGRPRRGPGAPPAVRDHAAVPRAPRAAVACLAAVARTAAGAGRRDHATWPTVVADAEEATSRRSSTIRSTNPRRRSPEVAEERLQRALARAGLGSRRRCEELIAAGVVTVNGRVATLGDKVDIERDVVVMRGVTLNLDPNARYLAVHKPPGVVTTMRDTHGRPDVRSLLPADEPRLFPVGRLDRDSEGLLLLTNDGDLADAADPSPVRDREGVSGGGGGSAGAEAARGDSPGCRARRRPGARTVGADRRCARRARQPARRDDRGAQAGGSTAAGGGRPARDAPAPCPDRPGDARAAHGRRLAGARADEVFELRRLLAKAERRLRRAPDASL